MELTTIILFCCTLSYTLINSLAVDKITRYQTFRDGDTIISAGGEFQLGFFSPGSSTNRYLGIWYKKISQGTVVWVANRDRPLMNTSGVVLVDGNGITILPTINSTNGIIWTATTSRYMKNPVVQLLDTGNLVLRGEDRDINNVGEFIWQSFVLRVQVGLNQLCIKDGTRQKGSLERGIKSKGKDGISQKRKRAAISGIELGI